MLSKTLSRSVVSILGIVFAVTVFIGFSGDIAIAEVPEELFTDPDLNGCGDNADFTTDFLIDRCKFKARGRNPYFILIPGWQFVLENEDQDEREVVTVLHKKKRITLDGRKIFTRVVEERALEWDEDVKDWITVEISWNWFAICKETNAVYYFGEDSRECDLDGRGGFNPDDETECLDPDDEGDYEPDTGGSWEAGKPPEDQEDPIAQPGMIMPGTFLLGAKYFQELGVNLEEPEESAIDRGEHVAMLGEDIVEVPAGEWEDCVVVIDTNPAEAEEDGCSGEDEKTYCPGIGIVKDQELVLVDYGFVNKKKKPIKKKFPFPIEW